MLEFAERSLKGHGFLDIALRADSGATERCTKGLERTADRGYVPPLNVDVGGFIMCLCPFLGPTCSR